MQKSSLVGKDGNYLFTQFKVFLFSERIIKYTKIYVIQLKN